MSLEDLRDHAGADDFVSMESPALPGRIALGGGLADVMQQGSPAKPEIGLPFLAFRHIVNHLQRMGEVLLMALSFHRFHALEQGQLRKELLQQAGLRIASSDSGTMVKVCSGVDNCAANRMARSIRSGSSL